MATSRLGNPLECSICTEIYSIDDHVPKGLACGHTYCNVCLERLNNAGQIECPKRCKKITKVPTGGVQDLVTNYSLIEMLDMVCASCEQYGTTTRCAHCRQQLCGQCLDQHVQLEYKPKVQATVNKAVKVKSRVNAKFQRFVEKMEETFSDCDTFCLKAKKIMNNRLQSTDFKIIEDKAAQYIQRLEDIEGIISATYHRINPDIDISVKSTQSDLAAAISELPSKYRSQPKLVFGSEGSGDGEFIMPHNVAVIHDKLHITDDSNSHVCIYTISGQYLSSYHFNYNTRGITTTSANDVLITHTGNQLVICDESGSVKMELGRKGQAPGEFNYPHGITADRQGLVYICDSNNNRVQVMKMSGAVVRMIGDTSGEGKLDYPRSVGVHPHTGDVYVTGYHMGKVNIYAANGKYRNQITSSNIPGRDTFTPAYLSFRSDGLLCITDRSKPHCLHIMKDGVYLQNIAAGFNSPRGSTFINNGDLVVCDDHRILIFTGI